MYHQPGVWATPNKHTSQPPQVPTEPPWFWAPGSPRIWNAEVWRLETMKYMHVMPKNLIISHSTAISLGLTWPRICVAGELSYYQLYENCGSSFDIHLSLSQPPQDFKSLPHDLGFDMASTKLTKSLPAGQGSATMPGVIYISMMGQNHGWCTSKLCILMDIYGGHDV